MSRHVRRTLRPNINSVGQPSPTRSNIQKTRDSKHRQLLKPALVLLIIIFLGWAGQIKNIEVENSHNSAYVAGLVAKGLREPLLPAHIFFLSSSQLEERLVGDYPDLFSEVKVTKLWLQQAIKVRVVERQPILRWQTTQGDFGIDTKGFAAAQLGRGEQPTDPLVVDGTNLDVKVGLAVAPARFVTFVKEMHDQLKPRTGLKFVRARITETTNELLLDTDRGYYLRLDTTRSASEQLTAVKLLLRKQIKPQFYIDLRLPHKAYYK